MHTYYKNQKDLAAAMKILIDDYWSTKLSEKKLKKSLNQLYENNKEKIIRDGDVTAIITQRLGKKRLELLSKVLDLQEDHTELV